MRTPQEKKILLQYVIGGHIYSVIHSPKGSIEFYCDDRMLGLPGELSLDDAEQNISMLMDVLAIRIVAGFAETNPS
jgi:hypothetical protein